MGMIVHRVLPACKYACDAHTHTYWRAGASQPSLTAGSDLSIYIYIGTVYIYNGRCTYRIKLQRPYTLNYIYTVHLVATDNVSRFRKCGERDTIIQTPR